MSRTPLLIAALIGAGLAATGIAVLRPGPEQLPGRGEAGGLEALLTAVEAEPRTAPVAVTEPGALAPHARPDEAAAIARDFLARPAPSDVDLAAQVPFAGAEDVPVAECAAYWPKVAEEELSLASATPERRLKDEIYAQLGLRQVLETKDCSCTGKVAPFEPVAPILAEVVRGEGRLSGTLFNDYATERRRLTRAVERLCGGSF